MSVTNSNVMGVYVLAGSQHTSALTIIEGTQADASTDTAATGAADGDYLHVYNGVATPINVASSTVTDLSLELAGCATNTSMDVSNTINEAICRDGLGGSTRHVAGGATSWSVSVDGLFNVTTGDATPADLVAIANENYYVIVKFDTGSTTYVGQALIESINIAGGVDDIATYSCSLTGQGKLYTGA